MTNKAMNYQLVIQFPLTDSSADDFDQLLMIENELNLSLRDKHQVNRHDLGSDVMNIYIHTDNPDEAFELVKNILSENDLNKITAAFSDIEGDDYSVIWPDIYNETFKII